MPSNFTMQMLWWTKNITVGSRVVDAIKAVVPNPALRQALSRCRIPVPR